MKQGALAVLAAVLAGCVGASYTPAPIPSEAVALGMLQKIVAVVESGDLGRLCEFGSGTCRKVLDMTDPGSAPRTGPIVLGSRVIESTPSADGNYWSAGGRVLELCGRDGNGRQYYTEMLIFEDHGRLIAKEPTFWSRMTIAGSSTVDSRPAPVRDCPGLRPSAS